MVGILGFWFIFCSHDACFMGHYMFVNFKTYEEGTGKKALSLSKLLSTFFTGEVEIIPVVQATDIREICSVVSLKTFGQHADPVSYGANTGHVLPQALRQAGAFGAVVNHAENKHDDAFVEKTINLCKQAGLKVMACAENLSRAKAIAKFSPDFLAIEPPELIGGNVSVSSAKPELISDSVREIHKIDPKIIVITGAGIKNSKDVARAIELGTQGVFVASGIVCAKDKESAVRELLGGFPREPDRGAMP